MNRFLPILVLLLLFPAVFSSAEPYVSEVNLDLVSVKHTEAEIRALLPLQQGDPVSPEKLDEAKDKLVKLGLFETVDVTTHQNGKGVVVTYHLAEALLVRKVSISGNYPYLAKKITRLSYLQEGTPFKEDLDTLSEQRIREFFEKEGYYGTTVTLAHDLDRKVKAVNIRIKIKKGKTVPLGEVTVTGNHHFSDATIHRKLFSYHKFILRRLIRRIRHLEQNYIDDGYMRARVRPTSVAFNPDTHRVDVAVDIQERKGMTLAFDGNRLFKHGTLSRHLVFEKERSYDRIAAERSIERLKDFYHLNGFLKPQISVDSKETLEKVGLTFTIDEGVRTRLKGVSFQGNHSFSGHQLAKPMQLETHTLFRQGFFRVDLIPEDIRAIEDNYHQHGYFEAKVTDAFYTFNSFGDQAILHITINEGKPYLVTGIIFEGNTVFTEGELLKKGNLKKRKKYNEPALNKAKDKIIAAYQAKGYPYADVSFRKSEEGNITFDIQEKSRVTISSIVLSGEYATKDSFIRNTLKIKEGDIYTYKKVLDAQLNLRRLGIFDHARVSPVGLEEERGNVSLLVSLQERKAITLDLQARYDTDKLASGEVLLTKRNLFGTAKQLQLRGIGGFQLSRGEVTLFAPRVYGASWNLVNQYFVQYENNANFNASSYGVSLGTLKNFGPNWSLLLKDQFTRFNIFKSQSNQTALAGNLFDSSFSELTTSAGYDTRNNYSDPQRGIYSIFSSELDTDLADLTNNFDILRWSNSFYRGLGNRFTLINNLRLGKLFRISNASRIPVQKLFFMGGNDTIRGFEQDAVNPSGGTTSILYNAELHFRIFNGFKIAGFFDTGSLTEKFSDISMGSFRESAGVGLRYFTPVGPIRADWGFILDRKPGEPTQRFHLSFGYFF